MQGWVLLFVACELLFAVTVRVLLACTARVHGLLFCAEPARKVVLIMCHTSSVGNYS